MDELVVEVVDFEIFEDDEVVAVAAVSSSFSWVTMQYDLNSHGSQSRLTEGFHLWKSSGVTPKYARIASHDSFSGPLLNHSTQSAAVFGSASSTGSREQVVWRTSAATDSNRRIFMTTGAGTSSFAEEADEEIAVRRIDNGKRRGDTIAIRVHKGGNMEKLPLVPRYAIILFRLVVVINPSRLKTTLGILRDARGGCLLLVNYYPHICQFSVGPARTLALFCTVSFVTCIGLS